MKRIYSLAKIAYLQSVTDIKPEFDRDEQGVVFATFPECDAISKAINDSKNPDVLIKYHPYVNSFTDIKKQISIASRNAF